MAVIKALASHVSVKAIIRYVTREDKTNENLVSAYHCSPYSAAEEMGKQEAERMHIISSHLLRERM